MDDQTPAPDHAPDPAPKRRRHLLLKAFVFLVLPAIALAVALPWLLGTSPGRAWVVGRGNARLAPGSIQLEELSLSWTRPIWLSGVKLRDSKGKVVLAAKDIRLDRGILGLLRSRPDYGTITVDGVTADVERRADGSIDVVEALGSVLKSAKPPKPGDPDPAVVVAIHGGTLRLASPELATPMTASAVEGTLTIVPGKPLEAAATLGEVGRTLELHATVDHRAPAGSTGDLEVTVAGKGWPIHLRKSGLEASGRFDGTIEAKRDRGRWSARGDTALLGVEATGPALAGDRLSLDRLVAACEAGQTATGWSILKLKLTSPVASLSGSGTWPASEGARLAGRVDLAALARMMPRAMRLRDGLTLDKGTATFRAEVSSAAGAERLVISASLDDLAASEGGRPLGLREPAHLTASAVRSSGKITVESLVMKAAGVDVTASGDLVAGVKLRGTVDLAALDAQAREWLDLGAVAASGQARLAADYRHVGENYKARFAAEFKDLKVAGLTAEPIAREIGRVDASAIGPRSDDGLPVGWREGQLDLKAGDLKVDLTATHEAGDVVVLGAVGLDLASPTPGRAQVKASVAIKGRVFEADEILAGFIPTDPEAALGTFKMAARGRLDLASGEALLTPLPGVPAGAIGLMAEGIKVSGLGRAGLPLRVDAALLGDLAGLDRMLAAWSGSPSKGLGGSWGSHLQITRSAAGRVDAVGRIDTPNVTAPGLRGPVTLAWNGGYLPEKDQVEILAATLSTAYGRARVAGNLYEVKARRICDLTATLDPRWETIDPILAASVEPNARLRASFRPIHWQGVLKADSTARLLTQQVAEIALDLSSAQAFGVTIGPAPVVLHLSGGGASFDPIQTTANGGPLTIHANLALDDAEGVWLRLLPGTRIDGAEINDAVSSSVLAFVAPVLSEATHVNGKVSVVLSRAMLPITAKGSAVIDGQVTFQDVQFLAGPLGAQVASLVGQPSPKLVLHQPMQLQVADGRVKQSGLSIPIPGGVKVDLDGSVGFDKTLDLRASVPLSARMLALDPKFESFVGGTKLSIPIRGTMAHPAIDARAMQTGLREAARTAGERGLAAQAEGLLNRVAGPNPTAGEPKGKPGRGDALGELEGLGRDLLQRKKP